MKLSILFLLAVLVLTGACSNKNSIKIKIQNPASENYTGLVLEITDPGVLEKISGWDNQKISVKENGKNLPCQAIESNGIKSLLIQADFKANEQKTFDISLSETVLPQKQLTQAELSIKEGGEWVWIKKDNGNEQWEYRGGSWKNVSELRVPEKHTDHSFDIRYEGPGWESDKIGYRFYLDWRNATDIFGKKTNALVLQNIGLDGFDSYHEMCPWGVDVLKVGNSLGIGSVGHWENNKALRVEKTDSLFCRVDYSGALESKITTNYYGWETAAGKTNLTSNLSIRAGNFLTRYDFELSSPLDNLCTGIVNLPNTVVLKSESTGKWGYFATFGVQSLQNDNLGMCVFYRNSELLEIAEDKYSHVLVLRPEANKLSYYFGAVWEQDSSGIKTEEAFKAFLENQLSYLNWLQ